VPAAFWVKAAHESAPHNTRAGVTAAERTWPRRSDTELDLTTESLLATIAKKEGVFVPCSTRLAVH